jgi:hypothetical protein
MENKNGTFARLTKDGLNYVVSIKGGMTPTWIRTTEYETAAAAFDYVELHNGNTDGFITSNRA